MKMTTSHIRNKTILVIGFFFSQYIFSCEVESPEDVVKKFYELYLNVQGRDSETILHEYVSEKLLRSINHSLECNYDLNDELSSSESYEMCSQKRECKKYKGNYICKWDGIWVDTDVDYFTKSQDVYPSWGKDIKVSFISRFDKETMMEVSLGGGADPIMSVKLKMAFCNKEWKIISVTE